MFLEYPRILLDKLFLMLEEYSDVTFSEVRGRVIFCLDAALIC